MTINVLGSPNGGLFNYVSVDQTIPISTFNSSLCAVIGISNTLGTLQVYRPTIPSNLNPFTNFVAGSGYIVLAHQNFTINTTVPLPSPTPTSTPVIPNLSQTPTPTPTTTPTATVVPSSSAIDIVFDDLSFEGSGIPSNLTYVTCSNSIVPGLTSSNPTADFRLYKFNFNDTNQINNYSGINKQVLLEHLAGQTWTASSSVTHNGSKTVNVGDEYRTFISPFWVSQYGTILYAQTIDDHVVQWIYQTFPYESGSGPFSPLFKVCSAPINVRDVHEDKYGAGSWSGLSVSTGYLDYQDVALEKSDILPIPSKRVSGWKAVDFNIKSPWTVYSSSTSPSLSSIQAWADTLSFSVSS